MATLVFCLNFWCGLASAAMKPCEHYLQGKTHHRISSTPVDPTDDFIKLVHRYTMPANSTRVAFFLKAMGDDPAIQPLRQRTEEVRALHDKWTSLHPVVVGLVPLPNDMLGYYHSFADLHVRRMLRSVGCGYPELCEVDDQGIQDIARRIESFRNDIGNAAQALRVAMSVAKERYRHELFFTETLSKVRRATNYSFLTPDGLDPGEDVKWLNETDSYLQKLEDGFQFIDQPLKSKQNWMIPAAEVKIEAFLAALEGARQDWRLNVAKRAGLPLAQIEDQPMELARNAARSGRTGPSPAATPRIRIMPTLSVATSTPPAPPSPSPAPEDPIDPSGRAAEIPIDAAYDYRADVPPTTREDLERAITRAHDAFDPIVRRVLLSQPAPVRLTEARPGAWDRFDRYFEAAKSTLVERDQLIDLLKLTFLIDGSILMMGPPGVAKSFVADLIGKSIRFATGAASYFSLQLTPDTTITETSGGIVIEDALRGVTLRNWREGALGKSVVFLDEFFDGRLKFIKAFMSAFGGREYVQGGVRDRGETRVFLAATNKYLNQIAATTEDDDPQATIDQFHTIYYAPDEFEDIRSIVKLGGPLEDHVQPELFFEDLDDVQSQIARVKLSDAQILRAQYIYQRMKTVTREHEASELALHREREARGETLDHPYRSTRIYSPSTLKRSFRRIAAVALQRSLKTRSADVLVLDRDVEDSLASYLPMQGPSDTVLDRLLNNLNLPRDEMSQLKTLRFERDAFGAIIERLREVEARDLAHTRMTIVGLNSGGVGNFAAAVDWIRELALRLSGTGRANTIDAEKISAFTCLAELIKADPIFAGLVAP